MGPQPYMRSVFDRNIVMRRISQTISAVDEVRGQIRRYICLPTVSTQHSRGTESSGTSLWKLQISQDKVKFCRITQNYVILQRGIFTSDVRYSWGQRTVPSPVQLP
jgi:hypothetical protein